VLAVDASVRGQEGRQPGVVDAPTGDGDVEAEEVERLGDGHGRGVEVGVDDHGGERSSVCEPVRVSTEREVIDRFRAAGYTHEFFIEGDGVRCPECDSQVLAPEDVTVDLTERTEGDSNPEETAIVFAVSDGPCGLKGVLVSAFGPEVSGPRADVLRRLGG
jgi:hypothetical protein